MKIILLLCGNFILSFILGITFVLIHYFSFFILTDSSFNPCGENQYMDFIENHVFILFYYSILSVIILPFIYKYSEKIISIRRNLSFFKIAVMLFFASFIITTSEIYFFDWFGWTLFNICFKSQDTIIFTVLIITFILNYFYLLLLYFICYEITKRRLH